MKNFIIGAFMLAGLMGFAQEKTVTKDAGHKTKKEHHQPKEKVTPEEQSKQLAKELNLDDNQKARVKTLYAEQEKARSANMPVSKKGEQPGREAMEAKIKKDNDAFDAKMKGVLSADQYIKWKALLKKQ